MLLLLSVVVSVVAVSNAVETCYSCASWDQTIVPHLTFLTSNPVNVVGCKTQDWTHVPQTECRSYCIAFSGSVDGCSAGGNTPLVFRGCADDLLGIVPAQGLAAFENKCKSGTTVEGNLIRTGYTCTCTGANCNNWSPSTIDNSPFPPPNNDACNGITCPAEQSCYTPNGFTYDCLTASPATAPVCASPSTTPATTNPTITTKKTQPPASTSGIQTTAKTNVWDTTTTRKVSTPATLPSVCQTNPCHNGGRCVSQGHSYRCLCFQGFAGKNCSQKTCAVTVRNKGAFILQVKLNSAFFGPQTSYLTYGKQLQSVAVMDGAFGLSAALGSTATCGLNQSTCPFGSATITCTGTTLAIRCSPC